jgi:predicted lipid-binding transport protein (Tim44 family)
MSESFYYIARAGGGQHFTSSHPAGSTSSSTGFNSHPGYSGNGQGGGFFSGLLLILLLPVIVIGVIVYLIFRSRSSKSNQTSADPMISAFGPQPLSPSETNSVNIIDDPTTGVAKIQSADPNFNIQVFKDKTSNAFYKIQEAWSKQDMSIARPFVSDAIMQRYTTMISDMRARNERDILENIVIGSMTVQRASADNNFDYITVRIDASAADYTVDADNKMVSGSKADEPFTEYWTMLRSVNTLTQIDKQLKDNKCPNCGAPLEVNAIGKCNYCGAIVSSGNFDWVLSQIDQNV